mgnify:CR=1 FL=1
MGLFSGIASFCTKAVDTVKSFFSGGSSHTYTSHSTTTYDPDRVKATQIDKERARAEGFVRIAKAVTTMQEKLNELAAQRIAIIERGTLQ